MAINRRRNTQNFPFQHIHKTTSLNVNERDQYLLIFLPASKVRPVVCLPLCLTRSILMFCLCYGSLSFECSPLACMLLSLSFVFSVVSSTRCISVFVVTSSVRLTLKLSCISYVSFAAVTIRIVLYRCHSVDLFLNFYIFNRRIVQKTVSEA